MLTIERSVAELERSGALPAGSVTYSTRLGFSDPAASPQQRLAMRSEWLDGALAALVDCDVVFADPDNGLRPMTHRAPRHHPKAVKHAYVDELGSFTDRWQAVVVYHHADRSATVDVQA